MNEISVIIPAHNAADTLERAVLSALEAGADEVVIVDDSSTDKTDAIAVRLFIDNDRTNLLDTGLPMRAGVCYARNYGIEAAQYDLIVPLDADDMLINLEPLRAAYRPGTFVYGNWTEPGAILTEVTKRPSPPDRLHKKNIVYATWLFHRDDWFRVGGYDPTFEIGGEDWAFMAALVQADIEPVYVDQIIHARLQDGPRTAQARAHYDVIRNLIHSKYPKVAAYAQPRHS